MRDAGTQRAVAGVWLAKYGALLAVLGALALVVFVRLRVADVPLERDEGEYAYAGQLILHGIPPYRLAYNMKFPGTYYAYALILAVLGPSPRAIHTGLMVVNAATTLLVFFIGRRLLGEFGAALAAATFALLSVDRWILGVFGHATHFVLLPALGGLLLLLRALDSDRRLSYLGAGVLLGLAVLMKQHAIFFPALGIAIVFWGCLQRKPGGLRLAFQNAALVGLGAAIPFAVVVALFTEQDVVGRFWFWTFQYAKEYVSWEPWSEAIPAFGRGLRVITSATLPFWLLAGMGFIALWVTRCTANVRFFLGGLLAASFLALCPGFYFREHYFILLLPAVALYVGLALLTLERMSSMVAGHHAARLVSVAVFCVLAASYLIKEHDYLFSMSPIELSRTRYSGNPFLAAAEIATYIREHTSPDDSIAVLGSEPEIYFYADRRPATGYLYTYPLMENQRYSTGMQDEMIRQIEAVHPEYVVFVEMQFSWLVRTDSDKRILFWADRYTDKCYKLVGIANLDRTSVRYVWGESGLDMHRFPRGQLYTFHRTSDASCVAG